MGKFLALMSDGYGKVYYFKGQQRMEMLNGKIFHYTPDCHTSIADYHGYKGRDEDILNRMEYNPILGRVHVDRLNVNNDKELVLAECRRLNLKNIVPELIIHPIVNPFMLKRTDVTEEEKEMIRRWIPIHEKANRVWDNSRLLCGNTVCMTVGSSISDEVGISYRGGIWDKIFDSASQSYWSYFASFFEGIKDEFTDCIKLWESGLVACNDNGWCLRGGKEADILYKL